MFAPDVSFDSPLQFDLGKLMEFKEGFYDILSSTFCEKLLKLPVAGTYRVTVERFRPDKISYILYGDEQYKMMLLMYNSLSSYLDIVPGLDLVYPSLHDMEAILFDEKVR